MAAPRIPETLAPDLLERVRARFYPWPLIKDWGLTITELSPGRAEMQLEARPPVVNGARGNVTGGVLATMADGVIYVVKFNKVRRDHARKSIQRLHEVGANVCGVLLNDIDFEGRDSYYYSYYYLPNRHYSTYYRSRELEVGTTANKPTKA